jgi:hypothetical protein
MHGYQIPIALFLILTQISAQNVPVNDIASGALKSEIDEAFAVRAENHDADKVIDRPPMRVVEVRLCCSLLAYYANRSSDLRSC